MDVKYRKEVQYKKHSINICLETQKDKNKYMGSSNMGKENSPNFLKVMKDIKPQIQKA